MIRQCPASTCGAMPLQAAPSRSPSGTARHEHEPPGAWPLMGVLARSTFAGLRAIAGGVGLGAVCARGAAAQRSLQINLTVLSGLARWAAAPG